MDIGERAEDTGRSYIGRDCGEAVEREQRRESMQGRGWGEARTEEGNEKGRRGEEAEQRLGSRRGRGLRLTASWGFLTLIKFGGDEPQ